MKNKLDNTLNIVHKKIQKNAIGVMEEQNRNGVLYSSLTLTNRVQRFNDVVIENLSKIVKNYNSRSDKKKIEAFIDEEVKNERKSLEKFSVGMKSIKLSSDDISILNESKEVIMELLETEQKQRWATVATFLIVLLTLLATIAMPIIMYRIEGK